MRIYLSNMGEYYSTSIEECKYFLHSLIEGRLKKENINFLRKLKYKPNSEVINLTDSSEDELKYLLKEIEITHESK